MAEEFRIVVFTGDLMYSVRRGIIDIDDTVKNVQWLIVWHAPEKPIKKLIKNQWMNIKKNGWRWISYQLGELISKVFEPVDSAIESGSPGYRYTLAGMAARPNIILLKVADLHHSEALQRVQSFRPSLGLSMAAPILKLPLFSTPSMGTLNLHKGRLPDYRGMPPAFWEFWNGEKSVGCSVHWVDEKLDTGYLLKTGSVALQQYSTIKGVQRQLDELGFDLMAQAVLKCVAGQVDSAAQQAGGRTYRKPNLLQVQQLTARLAGAQVEGRRPLRNILRARAIDVALFCSQLGLRKFLRPRITVVLYHRVSDDVRDNLTVGIEQFDRQMMLLKRHCQLVSLDDVLRMSVVPASGRPLVAVTFDDGYLDNYTNAGPALLRHGVPAAFFVSTGIVGTERAFPHDVRRGGASIPNMTWDQLRRMRDWGFIIGSHSVDHIDCAAEAEDTVLAELLQSKADLQRELGVQAPVFAYPYGGRKNMTAERLALVRQAGYVGCLSAYGGSNISTIDPFNVMRRGVHWEYSDKAFLLACHGLR